MSYASPSRLHLINSPIVVVLVVVAGFDAPPHAAHAGHIAEEEDSAFPALADREFHLLHRNIPALRRTGVDTTRIRQVSPVVVKLCVRAVHVQLNERCSKGGVKAVGSVALIVLLKLWTVLIKLCKVLVKPANIGLPVCHAVHVKLHTAPGNYIKCLSNLQTTVCPPVWLHFLAHAVYIKVLYLLCLSNCYVSACLLVCPFNYIQCLSNLKTTVCLIVCLFVCLSAYLVHSKQFTVLVQL